MIALIALLLFAAWYNNRVGIKALTTESHTALCALKQAKENDVSRAEAYLEKNPRGLISRNGDVVISAALIRQGIDDDKATLEALSVVKNC